MSEIEGVERNPVDQGNLRWVLDAMPHMVWVVGDGLRVLDANREARRIHGLGSPALLGALCGDVLCCVNALSGLEVCGTTDHCPECHVRQSVMTALRGVASPRKVGRMRLRSADGDYWAWVGVTATPFPAPAKQALLVIEDVTELVELRHLLPMCSHCHRVRDDEDYWQSVEEYLKRKTDVMFTHGLCPDCLRLFYPDEADDVTRRVEAYRQERADTAG